MLACAARRSAQVPPIRRRARAGGTVTGEIDAADVIGPAGQGIAAGAFNEILAAMRAGDAYANVHSTKCPAARSAPSSRRARGDHDNDELEEALGRRLAGPVELRGRAESGAHTDVSPWT